MRTWATGSISIPRPIGSSAAAGTAEADAIHVNGMIIAFGSLEPGKLAGFTRHDPDLLKFPAGGGEVVFEKQRSGATFPAAGVHHSTSTHCTASTTTKPSLPSLLKVTVAVAPEGNSKTPSSWKSSCDGIFF